jgi:hypothetical protein
MQIDDCTSLTIIVICINISQIRPVKFILFLYQSLFAVVLLLYNNILIAESNKKYKEKRKKSCRKSLTRVEQTNMSLGYKFHFKINFLC